MGLWELRDLDGDGRPELDSWDGRWAYWGGSYGFSGFPAQIWAFRAGTLVDVTRTFPVEVTKDQTRL
jgi:hypothetical protein